MFFTDLPINLGQEFRRKSISNFKHLLYQTNRLKVALNEHKTTDKIAHRSDQISHNGSTASEWIKYFNQRLKAQIVGANGDGIAELSDSRVSLNGTRFDLLSERLEYDLVNMQNDMTEQYNDVLNIVTRIRNVNDYGGDPTGQKDSTKAFEKAIEDGGQHVHMTAGTYLTTGLKLPSNTVLSGEGKDITILKLTEDTPQENLVVTNRDLDGTAENIVVQNLTIDGNRYRRDGALKPGGGSLSSGLRFAGVTHGYAYNVKTKDTLLHGIDVTFASDPYYYEGDGNRVDKQLESQFIHIDNCETTGFGDDGITTHHSRHLLITNNYSHNPAQNGGNNNGIEIDDGSQFVMLDNNMTRLNYGGIEVKAHSTASAASGVFINNHLSIEDTRSYNFRHIGHHRRATDVQSKTAYNITMSNSVALYPYANGVYNLTTPRALVISAFKNVAVSNFTAIGDGRFSAGQPAIALQFMTENVMLNNINIRGFKNAMADIKLNGGNNKGKNIKLTNINIIDSSVNIGIAGGAGMSGVGIYNSNIQGTGKGNGIELYNHLAEMVGLTVEGYKNNVVIGPNNYDTPPTVLKGGLSAASTGGGAVDRRAALIASTGESFAYDKNSFVLGSNVKSKAYGTRSGVINSSSSETLKDGFAQTIFNSRSVKSLGNYHFQMGYGDTNTPSTSNTKVDISGYSGNIKTAGSIKSGQDIGDLAEFFETANGRKIENGFIVTLNGRYIRKAQLGDEPLGVVSATAGLVMGDQMFYHKGKYLKDEFGVTLTEMGEDIYINDDGEEITQIIEKPILNKDYDPSLEDAYESRMERDEWATVGLIGQVFTRVDDTVRDGDKISAINGIGTKDNDNGYYRVLEVTTPYEAGKGYGVALVLVK